MHMYVVEIRGATYPDGDVETYEVYAPSPEQACYTAKDWYVNDFHAHDIDPDIGLVAVATLKGAQR